MIKVETVDACWNCDANPICCDECDGTEPNTRKITINLYWIVLHFRITFFTIKTGRKCFINNVTGEVTEKEKGP